MVTAEMWDRKRGRCDKALLRSWCSLQHHVGKIECFSFKCVLLKFLVQHELPTPCLSSDPRGSQLVQVSLGGRIALYKILPLLD